jgi:hypothetical protein
MKTEWSVEYFNSDPVDFVKANDTTWLQRKNIEPLYDPEDKTIITGYKCESRFISNDIYETLVETVNTSAHLEDEKAQIDQMDAIADLYSSQDDLQNDLDTTMEAIADIYSILEGGVS